VTPKRAWGSETSGICQQLVSPPHSSMCRVNRERRPDDGPLAAEIDCANAPISIGAARRIFDLNRDDLAASFLTPHFGEGQAFEGIPAHADLTHNLLRSSQLCPALTKNNDKLVLARGEVGKGQHNIGNGLDFHAYLCVGVGGRNRQNACVHHPRYGRLPPDAFNNAQIERKFVAGRGG
jgi:hypothetical protein